MNSFPRRKRRWPLWLFLFIVILSVAAFLARRKFTSARMEVTKNAESALALKNLFVYVEANVDQIALLERVFYGKPPAGAAGTDSSATKPQDRTLLEHLSAAGVDLRTDVIRFYFAAYAGGSRREFGRAILLLGDFYSGDIQDYLSQTLRAKAGVIQGETVFKVQMKDKNTCALNAPWMVTATDHWILLASPDVNETLLTRIVRGSQPEFDAREISQSRWSDQLTAALRVPEAPEVVAKYAGAGDLSDLRLLRFTAGLQAYPPAAVFRVFVSGNKPGTAQMRAKNWTEAIRKTKSRWARGAPALARLLDKIKITGSDATAEIDTKIDWRTLKDVSILPQEFLGLLFSPLGDALQTARPAPVQAQEIDDHPPRFAADLSPDSLVPYDDSPAFAEKVDSAPGPVRARLERIALGDSGLKLTVKAFSNAVPNVPDPESRMKLFVDSVRSKSNVELLVRKDCGRDLNSDPATFSAGSGGINHSEKTVTLKPEARVPELGSIAGHVEILLPVKTVTVSLGAAQVGRSVTENGATFVFSGFEGSRVTYEIWGDPLRVLAVQAFNPSGKPLAQTEFLQASFPIGPGAGGYRRFAGPIGSIAVTFSLQDQLISLPYALNDFTMRPYELSNAPGTPPRFAPYSYADLAKNYSKVIGRTPVWAALPPPPPAFGFLKPPAWKADQADAFEIRLERLAATVGLEIGLTVRAPNVDLFADEVQAGNVALTKVILADGETVTPPQARPRGPSQTHGFFGDTWASDLSFTKEFRGEALSSRANFRIESSAKPDQIREIDGLMSVKFPRAPATTVISNLDVGDTFNAGGVSGKVTAKTHDSVTLHFDRPSAVLNAIAVDGNGRFVRSSTLQRDGDVTVNAFGSYAKVAIFHSEKMDVHEIPFRLRPASCGNQCP